MPPLRALRAALPAVALLLLLTLPFAGRAHHIDDPLYLEAARQAARAPLDPLGGPSFWHDEPTTLFHDLYNPPLTAYLLAPAVVLGAGGELPVHLTMIALAAAALLAAAWAGAALGVPPRLCLLLAASPALCAAAVSAMADVPFLLLTLLAWGAAARGRAAWTGALAGLSALTKYAGVLNALLAVVPLARAGKRKAVVSLAVAGAVVLAWCLWNLSAYGGIHMGAAGRFQAVAPRRQAEFVLSLVAALGVAGLPAALGLIRWTRSVVTASLLAGAAGGWIVHHRGGTGTNLSLAFVAFAAGAALLAAAWRWSRRELRRDAFLPACFWGYAAYSVLLVYFGAARYLLPMLPPLVWLLARSEEAPAGRSRLAASVAAGALVSLLVLWGDAGYANAWRTAAERLPREGRRFQTGHWGFQWYAGGAGYTPLSARDVLEDGAVVVEPSGIHGAGPWPAQSAVLGPLSTVEVPSPRLRVMDARVQAGFYSSAWGLLPFAWRPGAAERVRVSTPSRWVLAAAAYPPHAPISVDLGTAEARHVLLDGWSGDEAFDDAGRLTRFVWSVGRESALRLPLPRGVDRIRLRVSPGRDAAGPLRLSIGPSATATVDLEHGWRTYEAPLHGTVAGGLTTVVLQPAGHSRPGWLARERRPLAVAVDAVAFGAIDPGGNRGVWPVATESGPGLLVADVAAVLLDGRFERARGEVRLAHGTAELSWSGEGAAWYAAAGTCAPGCAFDLAPPAVPARLVLRADHAIVSEVDVVGGR